MKVLAELVKQFLTNEKYSNFNYFIKVPKNNHKHNNM